MSIWHPVPENTEAQQWAYDIQSLKTLKRNNESIKLHTSVVFSVFPFFLIYAFTILN